MPTTLPAESFAELTRSVLRIAGTVGTVGAIGLVVVSALVGVALLLWGRVLHRALLVLVALPVGLAGGWALGPTIQVNPLVAGLVAGVALAVLAIVLARLLWAILAGLHVAGLVLAAMVLWYLDAPLAASQPAGQGDVLAQGQVLAQQAFQSVFAEHAAAICLATALSGLASLVVAFMLPRATVICMTSLLGAGKLSWTGGLAAMLWMPSLSGHVSANPYVSGGLIGGLLLVGIVFQSAAELRARRGAAKREKEPKGTGKQRPRPAADEDE